jgi:hypothetical protein
LTWFVGPTKAKAYLKSGEKVVEEDVVVEPAKISSAVQEEPVLNQLNRFQTLFTEDAWTSVLSLGTIPSIITITFVYFHFSIVVAEKEKETRKLCVKCSKQLNGVAILCTCCLERSHLSCEKISDISQIKSKNFTCIRCRNS